MKTKKPQLPPVEVDLHSLRKVIDYLFYDERKDYEGSGKPKDHIFRSVAKLAHSLNCTYVMMGVDPDSRITTSHAECKALMAEWRKVTAAGDAA